MPNKTIKRESGIELLKIIAMFLIVISHVTQTAGSDSLLNLRQASFDIKIMSLQLMHYFGSIGNNIFFICSAWFLCDSKTNRKDKAFKMIIDVWAISFIYLLIYYFSNLTITMKDALFSLFPSLFSNNWYISCYVVFYCVYPFINKLLDNIDQTEHFKLSSFLGIVYIVIDTLKSDGYGSSNLVTFIVIFIIISYIKKYKVDFCNNIKLNYSVAMISLFGLIIGLIAMNAITFKVVLSASGALNFAQSNNILIFTLSLSMLNIFRNKSFANVFINKVSSLTMYIYLIHENILFRSYTRVRIVTYLLNYFGKQNSIYIVLCFSLVLFIISIIISYCYSITISKLTDKLSKYITKQFNKVYSLIEKICL